MSFPSLVKDKWNFSSNMAFSLSNFSTHVKEWNRSFYGFISTRKKNLMRDLLKIQTALASLPLADCSSWSWMFVMILKMFLITRSSYGDKKLGAIGFSLETETLSIFTVVLFREGNLIVL